MNGIDISILNDLISFLSSAVIIPGTVIAVPFWLIVIVVLVIVVLFLATRR